MFVGFIKMLKALFEKSPHVSGLEQFIIAGNPQNSYDVEHLERQYERRQTEQRRHYY